MRLPIIPVSRQTPEANPRPAEFDPTPGGAFLASMKEGIVKLEAIDAAFLALNGVHGRAARSLKRRYKQAEFSEDIKEAHEVAHDAVHAGWTRSPGVKKWLETQVMLARPSRYAARYSSPTQLSPDSRTWLIDYPDFDMSHGGNSFSSGHIGKGTVLRGRIANLSLLDRGTIILEDGHYEVINDGGEHVVDENSPHSSFESVTVSHIFGHHSVLRSGIEIVTEEALLPQEAA